MKNVTTIKIAVEHTGVRWKAYASNLTGGLEAERVNKEQAINCATGHALKALADLIWEGRMVRPDQIQFEIVDLEERKRRKST